MSDQGHTTCALCGKGEDLQLSHIVPKFIVNWLKESSATGFLRGAANRNVRIQDGAKMRLLCSACEGELSRLEKSFAEEVFFPYQNEAVQRLSYDESMLKFIVSMGWKILYSEQDLVRQKTPNLTSHAEQALRIWRDYLLGLREDESGNEHHLFFLDFIRDGSVEVMPNFQWYTMRAVDGCLAIGQETVFAYTKFPGMILVSAVYPTRLDGWVGTRITRGVGEIGPPQEIAYPGFLEFLMDRASKALGSGVSEIQKRKLETTIRANPDRMLSSRSFEVFLAERKRARATKSQTLPRSVTELIGIVEESDIDPSLPGTEKNYQREKIDLVAHWLANLDMTAATRLHDDIMSNIEIVRRMGKEKLTITDLGDIVVFFLTSLGSNKSQRIARVDGLFEDIDANQSYVKAKVVLVFAWDPTDLSDMGHSWGCLIR
jgi:hypothetical protein